MKNKPVSKTSDFSLQFNAFAAFDKDDQLHTLMMLMGKRGLLLGFVGDLWMASSARMYRWLEAQTPPLLREGVATALVVCNAPHVIKSFLNSTPIPPLFPVLADADRRLHVQAGIEHGDGLLILDVGLRVRGSWLLKADAPPRPKKFLQAVRSFDLPAR